MKKLIFTAALFLSCFAFQLADAQLRINLNLNIGSQPDWGPVGYDHAEYYYLPDIDTYYSVPTHEYVYFNNNSWIHSTVLPARYRNYDLYNGYKVVVNQANPWQRADYYRSQYANYRGRRGQQLIRDSRDARYQNHWRGNGQGNNGRGNAYGHDNYGRGNGYGHDNGRGNNFGQGNNGHGNGWGNGHDNGRGHH